RRSPAEAEARRAGRPETDLFPHRAEIRDRPRKIPLADGASFCRLRRPPRRPRRDRRASGAVAAVKTRVVVPANAAPLALRLNREVTDKRLAQTCSPGRRLGLTPPPM